jgi:RNA polymerase subunit RPABC4/transcription elongation factor Spt4
MECPICLDNKFFKIVTNCNHQICINCILLLHKPECPLCRKNLIKEIPKKLLEIINNNSKNIKKKNNGLNLTDLYDFPPL